MVVYAGLPDGGPFFLENDVSRKDRKGNPYFFFAFFARNKKYGYRVYSEKKGFMFRRCSSPFYTEGKKTDEKCLF